MTSVITDRETAICNAVPQVPTAERESVIESSQTVTFPVQSAITERVRAVIADLTPPAVWKEQPASLSKLASYAHKAAWTRRDAGFIRSLGIWWCRLVGLPVTVACRYLEWIAQRPGRAATVAALIVIFWLGR